MSESWEKLFTTRRFDEIDLSTMDEGELKTFIDAALSVLPLQLETFNDEWFYEPKDLPNDCGPDRRRLTYQYHNAKDKLAILDLLRETENLFGEAHVIAVQVLKEMGILFKGMNDTYVSFDGPVRSSAATSEKNCRSLSLVEIAASPRYSVTGKLFHAIQILENAEKFKLHALEKLMPGRFGNNNIRYTLSSRLPTLLDASFKIGSSYKVLLGLGETASQKNDIEKVGITHAANISRSRTRKEKSALVSEILSGLDFNSCRFSNGRINLRKLARQVMLDKTGKLDSLGLRSVEIMVSEILEKSEK